MKFHETSNKSLHYSVKCPVASSRRTVASGRCFSAAACTHTHLFDDRHGEVLVRDAVQLLTRIFVVAGRQVSVNSPQYVLLQTPCTIMQRTPHNLHLYYAFIHDCCSFCVIFRPHRRKCGLLQQTVVCRSVCRDREPFTNG